MFKKGHKVSAEVRQKISAAQVGRVHKPVEGFKKGHPVLGGISTRFKKGVSRNSGSRHPAWGMRGEKSWNWKGGLSALNHRIRGSFEYRQWRSDIFKRDDFTCRNCSQRGGELHVDHFPKTFSIIIRENKIDSMDDAVKCSELWDLNNGRTMCYSCHKKRHGK